MELFILTDLHIKIKQEGRCSEYSYGGLDPQGAQFRQQFEPFAWLQIFLFKSTSLRFSLCSHMPRAVYPTLATSLIFWHWLGDNSLLTLISYRRTLRFYRLRVQFCKTGSASDTSGKWGPQAFCTPVGRMTHLEVPLPQRLGLTVC